MATAGLILSILASIFALIPVFGPFITIPLVIIGLPISIIAHSKSKTDKKEDKTTAKAAIWLNIIAVVIVMAWIIFIMNTGEELPDEALNNQESSLPAVEPEPLNKPDN